jgi:RNA polymerase sigma-70 factor (ECF subfamily)
MADEDVQRLVRERSYRAAFEALLPRYQQKVFRLVYSVLREPARSEEVAQDVFVKLWQVLPEYDGRASISTWLYTIARNAALSALRAENYRRTLPLEVCDPPAERQGDLQRLEIGQLVERLPEVERQVIMLFYMQDRSVDEVATMLDLPEGTVKSHLHRARRTLAKWMGN